jgi:lantibiotic modifying enzyme
MVMTESEWLSEALKGLRELAECSYQNFLLIHNPPYRSLNSGATGIAFTFWKAACFLDDPRWLHHARFWIDHTAGTAEDDRLVRLPEHDGAVAEIEVKDSLYHGNRGVSFVQALIAYSEHNPLLFNNAVRAFSAPEDRRLPVQELLQGLAGRLAGCTILYRETGVEYFRELGDSLAEDITATAGIEDNSIPWHNNHRLGLAHGRAGNYYSLLLWSAASGYKLPSWFSARLREYACSGRKQEHGISWPIDERDDTRYMNGWCNGAPGLIHLWALAYESLKERLFLETARAAGEYCIHIGDQAFGHLCCGAAGVSYAFLALNAIDPEGTWLTHALRFAEVARQGQLISQYRLGLYTGKAGIVCLMLDMADPKNAAQPAIR